MRKEKKMLEICDQKKKSFDSPKNREKKFRQEFKALTGGGQKGGGLKRDEGNLKRPREGKKGYKFRVEVPGESAFLALKH